MHYGFSGSIIVNTWLGFTLASSWVIPLGHFITISILLKNIFIPDYFQNCAYVTFENT